jgi:tetratricopeptide (TPR) repeat protein
VNDDGRRRAISRGEPGALRGRGARRTGVALVLSVICLADPAAGLSASAARRQAEATVLSVERDLPTVATEFERVQRTEASVEKRIARGELLKETKDYEAAIVELSKVLELHRQQRAPETAYADALFLIAETYFKDEQYLSARRHYEEVVDQGGRLPYAPYAGRALGRLVDVALRAQRLDGLDWVFERMAALPATDASGSLQYARAKAHFARGEHGAAEAAVRLVPSGSAYAHQAAYLRGVIAMKRGATADAVERDPAAFDEALEAFRLAAAMPAETDEQRHVGDLAWMAIGRIQYETGRLLEAVEAYTHVDRKSPEFVDTLFEIGWVYARMGDYARAQRALEVLSVAAPDELRFADGPLLRADILLRARRYEEALELYQEVRAEYDPMRRQLDAFLAGNTDPGAYYERLVRHEFIPQNDLPPGILGWVREEAREDRVFAIIDDVARSRRLIRESRRLGKKLGVALGSKTRVNAFPAVRAATERAVGLLNRLALSQKVLIEGAEDTDDSAYTGELAQVRARRRALMSRVVSLPTTPGDFVGREVRSERRWNQVSQKVQALHLEADRLQALANGLRRVLDDAASFPAAQNPAVRGRVSAELAGHDRDLAMYRDLIASYREGVDLGRLQVGFGDESFEEDDQIRTEFVMLVDRELALLAAGAGGSDAAGYARAVAPVIERLRRAGSYLVGVKHSYDAYVNEAAGSLGAQVQAELGHLEAYAAGLDSLDDDARLLVGEVAMNNFRKVRERLKHIVLRGDVGIFQQAWEVRESQRVRVRNLQRERAREEKLLNDELREVLDDAGREP